MTSPSPLPLALMGEHVLKIKADPVQPQDKDETRLIIEQMIETFHSLGERVGLAAPQVFMSKRIVIYRVPTLLHPRYQSGTAVTVPLTPLINPVLTPLTQEKVSGWEACVSLPGLVGQVERYRHVRCTYETLEGETLTMEAEGFHARVLQHECDHLDGLLFIDRMRDMTSLCYEQVLISQQALLDDIV